MNTMHINLKSIISNINNIKKLNKKIIFVVKGNVYGFGFKIIPYLDKNIESYAVSSISEAKELKKYTSKNILILSPVIPSEIVIDNQITYVISSIEQFNRYIHYKIQNINIAMKINTGLNRFRERHDEIFIK